MPGPGFASSRNRIDWPVSAASCVPNGVSTPWLMALFRKNTFAGSMMMLVSGSRFVSTSQFTAPPSSVMRPLTSQAIG